MSYHRFCLLLLWKSKSYSVIWAAIVCGLPYGSFHNNIHIIILFHLVHYIHIFCKILTNARKIGWNKKLIKYSNYFERRYFAMHVLCFFQIKSVIHRSTAKVNIIIIVVPLLCLLVAAPGLRSVLVLSCDYELNDNSSDWSALSKLRFVWLFRERKNNATKTVLERKVMIYGLMADSALFLWCTGSSGESKCFSFPLLYFKLS